MKKKIGRMYIVLLLGMILLLLCSCGRIEKKEEYEQTMAVYVPTEEVTAIPTKEPAAELRVTPIVEPEATSTPEPKATSTPEPKATSTPEPEVTSTPEPEATLTPEPEPSPTPVAVNPLEGTYWREVYSEDTEVLLTPKEIKSLNEKNFKANGTNLVKLSGTEQLKSEQIVRMIESYSFPKLKYYANREITAEEKDAIYKARNLEILQSTDFVDLSYGILIQNTDLRSFPTEKRLTSKINGRYDYLQETVLLLNEAVIVLHTSEDGKWCFVQAENYYGWIREASIAFCDKEEMNEWYEMMSDTESEKVLLVTKNMVYETEEAPVVLRMGTRLLYEEGEGEKRKIVLPTRDEEKRLIKKTYDVETEEDFWESFHRGYFPFTRKNIVSLATELLDTPYAWGDALPLGKTEANGQAIGMDCSSTVAAVYRCFGIVLPRNTGAQRNMDCNGYKTEGASFSERVRILDKSKAGALLYSPGHVMLYLGKVENEYYILHNTTTEVLPDGTEEAYYRCVITTMNLGKKGENIVEQLLEIKMLE